MSEILPAAATFSKSHKFFSGDPDWQPRTVDAGEEARILGSDDKWYLDWISSLGANLLGHHHPGWTANMIEVLTSIGGCGFSLPHYLEQQVAEKLCTVLGTHVPGWAPDGLSVRFGLSGSDACAMAVRLARAVTGRQRILSIGYHGWGAEFVAATPPAWGVPIGYRCDIEAHPFGDLAILGNRFGDLVTWDGQDSSCNRRSMIAAIIIEQLPQKVPADYWQMVRRLCDKYGALLILDEVVTGLRFGLGGAAEQFDIHPDIAVYGKALGNGVPISAMVFPREMASWFSRSDPVFVSSTHFGCTLGLASADYVLDNWTVQDVEHLWRIGDKLMEDLGLLGFEMVGYPPESLLKHKTPSHRAYFIAGMRDRGILWNRPTIPCRAHTLEDVKLTVDAAHEVRDEMAGVDVEAVMAGKLPQTLFENR